MSEMKKGFTLIELLVVVLIIGILSAIALPQYTKAVMKSRAAGAWPVLRTLDQAVSAYCLANPGSTTKSLDSLDIQVPTTDKNFQFGWGSSCKDLEDHPEYASVYAVSRDNVLAFGYDHIDLAMRNGKRYCGSRETGNADSIAFCKSLGMTYAVSGTAPCGMYPSHNCYMEK